MTHPDHAESELEARRSHQDVVTGLMLALFAASLALCDLGGGRFGHEQILAANEKAQGYSSSQAKSVKQSLTEGEAGLLKGLLVAEAIAPAKVPAVSAYIQQLDKKAAQYEKEKTEFLVGSEKGGHVVGAKYWEDRANGLDRAGEDFDLGSLYLQLCIETGAVGIVIRGLRAKRTMGVVMAVLGLVGTYYAYIAYQAAWLVP